MKIGKIEKDIPMLSAVVYKYPELMNILKKLQVKDSFIIEIENQESLNIIRNIVRTYNYNYNKLKSDASINLRSRCIEDNVLRVWRVK